MKIEQSCLTGVELLGPGSDLFHAAVALLYGREPDDVLRSALDFSVIAKNCAGRAIALLGIRFDMIGPQTRPSAVIHYADTLRNPEQAALGSGALRFVCAEPAYTDLVLRRANEVDARGRMNLDHLRRLLGIRAAVDCVAFDDGHFAGPDSLGAFERLGIEREAEIGLLDRVLRPDADVEMLLREALETRPARALARRLQEAFESGGRDKLAAHAHQYRPRIGLWR